MDSLMSKELQGKTALITGAGMRIGHSIAIALAKEGANIVMHYPIQVSETDELRSELQRLGVKWWPVKADFTKPEEYESLIEKTLEAAGALDILVNNAAIFSPGGLKEINFPDLLRHIQVNAWAPLVLSRDFARLVGGGKIINILDAKIVGYDFAHIAYISSKHMLSLLTKMTALEFAPRIAVNAIAPGLILPPAGKDETYLNQLAQRVPLKRHGGPDDIADAAIYLLKSDFLTGQIIYVDGGRHLMEYSNGPHPDR
jgi:NAD(P)-dependent dehydrogenase (short-subunit alcohol dehydrogenase family)